VRLQRLTQVLVVVIPLLAYELAAQLQLLDPFTFIPLSGMVVALIKNLADPAFIAEQIWPTVLEILISFIGATLLGVAIGIMLWRSNFLYYVTQPYLLLFYAVPFFAIYPIFISIFGLGPFPVVSVALLFSLPMVVVNTAIGFRETREVLIKVGQSFNLSFGQLLFHVFFPAAWPQIFTGLRLAAAYSIIGVIATEFILSSRGIGYTISFAYNNFDLETMYASVLLVIIFATVVIAILEHFASRLHR
jgi:NitT/TauT family transport system permease protein